MASRRNRRVKDDEVTHDRKAIDDQPVFGKHWWQLDGRDQSSAAWTWADQRRTDQRGYDTLDLIHEAMYEGRPVGRRLSVAALEFLAAQRAAPSNLNVMSSLVDAVHARITKRRPFPVISADDAEYSEKLYARRASRVLRRKLGQPVLERMKPLVMRDCAIRGDGFIKVIRKGGDVSYKRVPRSRLIWDDSEAVDGAPRTLCHHELVQRDELMTRYPKEKTRLSRLPTGQRETYQAYDWDASQRADMVEVLYAYRLPTDPKAKDGAYAVCVRDLGEPLESRPWTRPRYPFAGMTWTPPNRGIRGIGLIQQMAGHQGKVNEIWRDHQESLYWGSGLKVFVRRGTAADGQDAINKQHLRARHPVVIEHDGEAPQYISANPASTQAMDSLRWLVQQMYELSGVSQASAASKNPLGPNASGKALDTMYDIESDRFSQIELQYALMSVDLGMATLDEAQEMADDEMPPGIKLASWIKTIDWDKFDFDGGGYHLVLEPINFLPDARSGKLDAVADMAKIPGLLDPMQLASLFDEPDIARANRHLLGPMRRMEKLVEKLCNLDVPQESCTPTPYMLQPPGFAKKFVEDEMAGADAEMGDDLTEREEMVLGRFRWFLTMLEGVTNLGNGQVASPIGAGPPGAMPPSPGAAGPPMPGASPPGPPIIPGNGLGGMDAAGAAGIPQPIMMPPGPMPQMGPPS